ncbi:MAG: hypothetical protein IJ078_07020 [Succinivibrionaceae bacterium]|nr:hypothetical protein [Succinivibrionaceae bacterium]
MANQQVKSKDRVLDYGEVFTDEREVNAMCDLVKNECLRIDSRILEPACGDGNFLAEILSRKLEIVTKRYRKSPYDFERNSLLAVGSIYGVDIMFDNVKECRERLLSLWEKYYKKAVKKADYSTEIVDSISYILSKNIVCGNALTYHCVDENAEDTEQPIVFSQWAFATGPMIKREDYIFEDLLNQTHDSSEPLRKRADNTDEGTLVKIYPPIHYRRLKEYD